MTTRVRPFAALAALAAALALAACSGGGGEDNLAGLDNELANETDPALTSALADQIAVDPTLSQQSNRNAARPPETPRQTQVPVTKTPDAPAPKAGNESTQAQQHAQLAGVARGEGGASCGPNAPFDYNPAWASRLSAAFPVLPGSKLVEAAGNDSGDCRVRAVTFTTQHKAQRVLDWYHSRAVRSGYSSEHQVRQGDHILAGTNEADGGAFYLIVTPRPDGSEVALIANNGR